MKASSKPTNKRCCLKTEVSKIHGQHFPRGNKRDWLVCVIKTSWICSFLQCCWMPVSCLTALETARASTAGTTGEGSSVNRRHKHSWNVLFFSFVNFFRFICGMKSFREHQIVCIKACFRLHFAPQHTETQPASEWLFIYGLDCVIPSRSVQHQSEVWYSQPLPHGWKAVDGPIWDHECFIYLLCVCDQWV